jgi:hypothetical protein
MDFLKRFFNNPSGAIKLILVVIFLFIAYAAIADDELEVAVGPTYTSQFNGGGAITISRRWGGNVDTGLTLLSAQSWENVNIGNNGTVWVAFVAHRPAEWVPVLPSEVSIGANYWFKEQSPINGCKPGWLLKLTWDLPQWGILPDVLSIDHRSNAGICSPNRGQDMLMLGWRF